MPRPLHVAYSVLPRWDAHTIQGTGTTPLVLGALASIIGSEFPGPNALAMPGFTLPFWRIIPPRVGVPNLEHLDLSGRPDADFHGAVNFVITEFSEVAPALLTLHT